MSHFSVSKRLRLALSASTKALLLLPLLTACATAVITPEQEESAGSAPLTVPLVIWAWSRERIPASAWLPLAIGLIGIAVILRPTAQGLSWWHAAGFVSALCLAREKATA